MDFVGVLQYQQPPEQFATCRKAEVMKLVNGIMKASEMALTMQEFSCKMLKVQLSVLILLLHVRSLVLGLEFELNSEFGGVVFPGR
jgi:hypothetical protein